MTRSLNVLLLAAMLTAVSCENDPAPIVETATPEEPAGNDEIPQRPRGSKKLDYYIDSYKLSEDDFSASSKVSYEYTATGKLSKYTVFTIDPKSGVATKLRYFVFSYNGEQLTKIEGYDANGATPFQEDHYEYFPDGSVSKIRDIYRPSGINSEVKFVYDTSNEIVRTAYTFSNGGSFEYEFKYSNRNILNDKTTKGAQLCSAGQYTYDDHINPLGNLGYVDYLLTTLSKNNKLTENVNHVNCSFPTLVPESYSYIYDDEGYPTIVTTTYKSKGTQARSKREYFYK